MGKAEEKALKAYPKMSRITELEGTLICDGNAEKREGFIEGYNQATEEILEAIKNHLLNHGYMKLWEFEAMLSFTKIK